MGLLIDLWELTQRNLALALLRHYGYEGAYHDRVLHRDAMAEDRYRGRRRRHPHDDAWDGYEGRFRSRFAFWIIARLRSGRRSGFFSA